MPNFKNLLSAAALTALKLTSVSSAKAAIIMVDPGTPGQTINQLQVSVTPGDLGPNNEFHVVFSDMKHVEFTMPTGTEILTPAPGQGLPPVFLQGDFYLTDESHLEIGGTRRSFAFFAGMPFLLPGLFEPLIFHDFHFEFLDNPFPDLPQEPNNIVLQFTPDALVGEWGPIPEPGALAIFGIGLFGFGLIRRQNRAV